MAITTDINQNDILAAEWKEVQPRKDGKRFLIWSWDDTGSLPWHKQAVSPEWDRQPF